MTDSARVEVLGFAELAAGSAILARRIDEGADAGPRPGGRPGRPDRRGGGAAAHRSPGRLGARPAQGDASGVQMGAGIRYAPFVEYGGRGHEHSAQGSYLYPAATAAEPALVAAG